MNYEHDEMFDEAYSTLCFTCHENKVDTYEEKCVHCMLEEMSNLYSDVELDEEVYA